MTLGLRINLWKRQQNSVEKLETEKGKQRKGKNQKLEEMRASFSVSNCCKIWIETVSTHLLPPLFFLMRSITRESWNSPAMFLVFLLWSAHRRWQLCKMDHCDQMAETCLHTEGFPITDSQSHVVEKSCLCKTWYKTTRWWRMVSQ